MIEEDNIQWGDIPPVLPANKLLDKGFKRAAKVHKRGRTKVQRNKSESIAKVQTLGDTISSTLESYVKAYPSIDRLPEFHKELIDIMVNTESLKKDLGALNWCRLKVAEFTRAYVKELGRLDDVGSIELRRKEAYGRISSLVDQISKNLESLEESRRVLRNVPMINPEAPTIVVAGMANVGKSQFVAAASSAKPKVANYPFTTQEVSVGHITSKHIQVQIIDTPGLLDRPAEKRNKIEQQAANALKNLARIVVFLLDPSETCGFTMDNQLKLLERLKAELPGCLFIEVENKTDLCRSETGRRKVSALTGEGIKEVVDELMEILTSRVPGASPP